MNKQPVSYLQTDPRWKSKPYRVPGETATIGSSGCGPTAAAMLIETITGKTYTPVDACAWSIEHGYKALKQGTYYAYFKPQFAAFGISCDMLNWSKTYGKPDHTNHQKVLNLLKQGYYIIALMGPGLWTTGGHFVVVWWADGKIRINDPANTKEIRLNGDPKTFFSQVNYYWWVDARAYNNAPVTAPAEPEGQETVIYTVKRGDTLWGISRKANSTVNILAEINGITNANVIHVGQVLMLEKSASPGIKGSSSPRPGRIFSRFPLHSAVNLGMAKVRKPVSVRLFSSSVSRAPSRVFSHSSRPGESGQRSGRRTKRPSRPSS